VKPAYPGAITSIRCAEHEILALLHHGDADHPAKHRRPAVLRLHGLMGNLLDETESYLSEALVDHGVTSMTINTLLSNLGLVYGFGVFEHAMPQVATACTYLRDQGHDRIVLIGHGLGACLAISYAATVAAQAGDTRIDGLVAIATPWSLPETIEARWSRFGSDPSYQEVCRRVTVMQAAPSGSEEAEDRTILIYRAHGSTDDPAYTDIYTLKTWAHLVGPDANGTQCHLHIPNVCAPTLLLAGARDEMVNPDDTVRLATHAQHLGRLSVHTHFLDADHTFNGKHGELAAEVVNWIETNVEESRGGEDA
jgi:pimeloyl-ACP methyl ester carboxylesterase